MINLKEYKKQWYLKNIEKLKSQRKQYYIDNIERFKEYRLRNREKLIKECKLWRESHPNYWKKQEENRRKKHKFYCIDCGKEKSRVGIRCKSCAMKLVIRSMEHINRLKLASIKSRGKKRPEICGYKHPNWKGGTSKYLGQYVQKRHLLLLKLEPLNIKKIQTVYENNIKKNGTLTCYLCLNPIEFGKDTIEHKQPISRGGTNDYSNLAIACRHCNSKKHNKTEQEYLEWRIKKLCL